MGFLKKNWLWCLVLVLVIGAGQYLLLSNISQDFESKSRAKMAGGKYDEADADIDAARKTVPYIIVWEESPKIELGSPDKILDFVYSLVPVHADPYRQARLLARKAVILRCLGKLTEADTSFNQANPVLNRPKPSLSFDGSPADFMEAEIERAVLNKEKQDYNAADKVFTEVGKLHPTSNIPEVDMKIRYLVARWHEETGSMENLSDRSESAEKLSKESWKEYEQLSREGFAEAGARVPVVMTEVASIERRLGHPEAADDLYGKVEGRIAQNEPKTIDDAVIRCRLGDFYLASGKKEASERFYLSALSALPDVEKHAFAMQVYRRLATARAKAGKTAEAYRDYGSAIGIADQLDGTNNLSKAQLYLQYGDFLSATKHQLHGETPLVMYEKGLESAKQSRKYGLGTAAVLSEKIARIKLAELEKAPNVEPGKVEEILSLFNHAIACRELSQGTGIKLQDLKKEFSALSERFKRSSSGPEDAKIVSLTAKGPWEPTGVTAKAGDVFTIKGEGTWSLSGTYPQFTGVGWDWVQLRILDPAIDESSFLVPRVAPGTLVAKIGNDTYYVGDNSIIQAKADGDLLLSINDSTKGHGFTDNVSAMRVKIQRR